MALENKKLSTYDDLLSSNIDTTTKLVVLTGATKVNANLPVTSFVEDSLTSSSVVKPLSAAKGKSLQDTKAPIVSPTFTGTVTMPANVSGLTKAMVGLSNVDNTSDANKLISTATQNALNLKMNITSLDSKRDVVLPIRADGTGWTPTDAESIVYVTTNATAFSMDLTSSPLVGTKVVIKNGNIAGCTISIIGYEKYIDGVDRDFEFGTPLALNTAYNSLTLVYVGSNNWITI